MQQALEHSHTRQAIRERLARGPRSNYLRDRMYGESMASHHIRHRCGSCRC